MPPIVERLRPLAAAIHQHRAHRRERQYRGPHQQAARREEQLEQRVEGRHADAEESGLVEAEHRVPGDALDRHRVLVGVVGEGPERPEVVGRQRQHAHQHAARIRDSAPDDVPARERVEPDDRARDRERILGRDGEAREQPGERPPGRSAAAPRARATSGRRRRTRARRRAGARSTWSRTATRAFPHRRSPLPPCRGRVRGARPATGRAAASAPRAARRREARAPTPCRSRSRRRRGRAPRALSNARRGRSAAPRRTSVRRRSHAPAARPTPRPRRRPPHAARSRGAA